MVIVWDHDSHQLNERRGKSFRGTNHPSVVNKNWRMKLTRLSARKKFPKS